MKEFLIEEYKTLTTEMQNLMAEARKLELYCAGAVAALYSWFLTSNLSIAAAWFLPLIIPVLGLIRSWALYERVKQISEYVQKLESSCLAECDQVRGWENNYKLIRKHGLTPSGILFWLVLIVLCMSAPFIFEVVS